MTHLWKPHKVICSVLFIEVIINVFRAKGKGFRQLLLKDDLKTDLKTATPITGYTIQGLFNF